MARASSLKSTSSLAGVTAYDRAAGLLIAALVLLGVAVVVLLADRAALTMPPVPESYHGREAIAGFLARVPLGGPRWRLVPTSANGQPAFGAYRWDGERFAASEIIVLTLDGDRIAEITALLSTEPFERFGLPDGFRRCAGSSRA